MGILVIVFGWFEEVDFYDLRANVVGQGCFDEGVGPRAIFELHSDTRIVWPRKGILYKSFVINVKFLVTP